MIDIDGAVVVRIEGFVNRPQVVNRTGKGFQYGIVNGAYITILGTQHTSVEKVVVIMWGVDVWKCVFKELLYHLRRAE